ncbi:hypothetical protein OG21DRAFT_1513946 [Imleria badia]|nr:hypothetical protein OG21DRAFT_1513946 [Imleria badia]
MSPRMIASPHMEIDVGVELRAVTFTANGEYLVSGGTEVQVWRVEDGKKIATMKAGAVFSLAVSKDGRWIAAGTYEGEVIVWDSKTYEAVCTLKKDSDIINALDFSPDSTRLVSGSDNRTAMVWDVTMRKQVQTLCAEGLVIGLKYSAQGDRIATGTRRSVRVWDSNEGHLLVDIKGGMRPYYNGGLRWFNNHLFVVDSDKIKEFDASTGSAVSEWSVPSSGNFSCITLPQKGEFIAYSTTHTVTFWDTSTHTQLGLIQHSQDVRSIALSPDARFLEIAGENWKIAIKSLSGITHSSPLSPLSPTFEEPDIQVDDVSSKHDQVSDAGASFVSQAPFVDSSDTVLDSWNNDQLADTEASLTETITNSRDQTHHALANRALVQARSGHSDLAIEDAENSIKSRPSVNGYIAKSVALISGGKKAEGCRVYDLAFKHCHLMDVDLILLIKAIVVFMAGEHRDAISRVDDLIATVQSNSICYVVQAYMYLLLGKLQLEKSNYESAIQSFEHARTQTRSCVGPDLSAISLISGWKFDELDITVQQHLCDALYAAGRRNDATESLLKMVNTLDEAVYMSGPLIKWVSDWTHQYLSAPEGDAASNLAQQHETPVPTPLLREWAKATLANSGWKVALVAAGSFMLPRVTTYQAVCERLVATDRVTDAVDCFHELISESGGEVYMSGPMTEWVSDFTQRCLSARISEGETASNAAPHGNTPTLDPTPLLREWAKATLTRDSWKDALASAVNFTVPRVTIYRAICERLETIDRITDAFECVKQLTTELGGENNLHGGCLEWIHDFRQRSSKNLEHLGDIAADAQRYDEAISHYTTALSLNLPSPQYLLIKRSKAYLATGSWKHVLDDANQAITLDPSSPWGYEMKHAALHEAGEYDSAVDAFEVMLSKIVKSHDPDVQQHGDQYISPSSTRATISKIVQCTTRHLPRVLINTTTGRLHDRAEQASAFEALPIFNELVSSMTTRVDYVRIKREVRQYFRYVMLSHKWENNEPLFQQVVHIAVYDLDESPTHDKLQTFCKIVRDAGFDWAWSDTCCINKSDHFVLQEALVAMFKWYQGSAMMIVFLRGVRSPSQRGALVKSIWNTRAWTLQEYVASNVIHFYTEDWTLYHDLQLSNHKESPEIISEMEDATGVSAEQLMGLRPGLTNIREKLRLASTRQTTLVEDAAYSLLGIFSVTGIPAIYGEGEGSLGRLLAHVLTGSGDVSILAWTGESGSFNSCLPAHITVFNGPAASPILPPLPNAEMERLIAASHTSFDLDVALRLYDRLDQLSSPWFAASRMKLPCIAFQLPPLSSHRARSGRVYRVDTVVFGMVEIKTRQDLSRMKSLYLIHPWLDIILDRNDTQSGSFIEDDSEVTPPPSPHTDEEEISDEEVDDDSWSVPDPKVSAPAPPAPVHVAPMDREMRARRLVARLRQPFGALLVAPAASGRRAVDYRRVAADSLITVQIQENVSLTDLLKNVCTLDVL